MKNLAFRKMVFISILKTKGKHINLLKYGRNRMHPFISCLRMLTSVKTGLSQNVRLFNTEKDGLIPVITSAKNLEPNNIPDIKISYHTTGLVNYHNTFSESQLLEPLCNVENINTFFILSIFKMDTLKKVPIQESKKQIINIDVTGLAKKGFDVVFSIVPPTFMKDDALFWKHNRFAIDFKLFRIMVEFVDDKSTFHFGEICDGHSIATFIPRLGKECNRKDIDEKTKNDCFLKYQHLLYKRDDLIVLPPNEKGIIEIIFAVEMYREPWIKVMFEERGYKIIPSSVQKSKTKVSFKIKDKAGNVISDMNRIHIKDLILDAEIYDDESKPPEGFI